MKTWSDEAVETELDRLVERRRDPEDRRTEDEFLKITKEKTKERRERNRALWIDYFASMAQTLRARADDYDRRREALTGAERT